MKAIGGRAKSSDFFIEFKNYFSKINDYNIWIAKYEDQVAAALLVFYFRDTVEYYMPVTRKIFRNGRFSL